MTNPADRARVAETDTATGIIAKLEVELCGHDPRDRLWDDGEREKLAERIEHALSAVRESSLREAVDKLSDLPGPRRSCCTCCDDGYGDAVDHALAAVRALLPAPPTPPTKGTDVEK